MSAIFVTETGSTYEVDREGMRVRRLNGAKTPTQRQGSDGAWKNFSFVSELKVGREVLITWTGEVKPFPDSPPGAIPSTITSPIKEIVSE